MNSEKSDRAAPIGFGSWREYWKAHGMPWRREPEIDEERQQTLRTCLETSSEISAAQYISLDLRRNYPFGGMRLSRADIEWLLEHHSLGGKVGPVDWADVSQRDRTGLDLRGADLHSLDLSELPLAGLRAGLDSVSLVALSTAAFAATLRQPSTVETFELARRQGLTDSAAVNLQDTRLVGTHLEGAVLTGGDLKKADLHGAHLAHAELSGADLRGADLGKTDLEQAILKGVLLHGSSLFETNLLGADLTDAEAQLVQFRMAVCSGARFNDAHLEGANFEFAHLDRAFFNGAFLHGAFFQETHLDGASLRNARLFGATLEPEIHASVEEWRDDDYFDYHRPGLTAPRTLFGAYLGRASLDRATKLDGAMLGAKGQPSATLADIDWGGANLTVIDWGAVPILGDETDARRRHRATKIDGRFIKKSSAERLEQFRTAVRANRQVAAALRDQGLNEYADHFAYRSQLLQRKVLHLQRHYLRAFGSWFLDLISGYGYRPMRSFITYALVVLAFGGCYYGLASMSGRPLAWNEAVVISMTAFHGRGFFSSVFQPGDLQAAVAAIEAFIGLLIEIVFIATFTQRFFAR